MSGEGCPRCGSDDLSGLTGVSAGCEWGQTLCENCEHRWGDGLPDSQERPLEAGYVDCDDCQGQGGDYGRRCHTCNGDGIVAG